MTKGKAWTTEEDRFLFENPHISAAAAAQVLPRTEAAIYDRRCKLRKAGAPLPAAVAQSPTVVGARTLLARTCPDCGLFMDARWFRSFEPEGVRERTCKRCVRMKRTPRPEKDTDRAKKLRREAQLRYRRSTADVAKRSNQVWLEKDYEILANQEMTLMEKALALNRTYSAVCQKASVLGYRSKVGLGDPTKNEWAISAPNAITRETAA